jgi:hypothetical protein
LFEQLRKNFAKCFFKAHKDLFSLPNWLLKRTKPGIRRCGPWSWFKRPGWSA